MLQKCKRYTVKAIGYFFDEIVKAANGNHSECSGEIGKCGCTHAEINLLKLMPKPQVVWVSVSPCLDCAKELVRNDVKVVFYESAYRKTEGLDFLHDHNVSILKVEEWELNGSQTIRVDHATI